MTTEDPVPEVRLRVTVTIPAGKGWREVEGEVILTSAAQCDTLITRLKLARSMHVAAAAVLLSGAEIVEAAPRGEHPYPPAPDATPCPSTLDGEPCTVRGEHVFHYGPDQGDGVRRMWQDGDAVLAAPAPGDDALAGFCGKVYQDAGGKSDWCAEPAGHEPPCGDPVMSSQREAAPVTGRDVLLSALADHIEDAAAQEPEPGTQAYADKYASRAVQRELLGMGAAARHADEAYDAEQEADQGSDEGDADGGCLEVSQSGSACVKGPGHDVVNGTPHEDAKGLRWDDDGVIVPIGVMPASLQAKVHEMRAEAAISAAGGAS